MGKDLTKEKTVLIAGGTGLIGKYLAEHLEKQGYEIRILSRTPHKISKYKSYFWDVEKQEIDIKSLENIETVINIAGQSIGQKRWSRREKNRILNSRVNSAKLLLDAFKQSSKKPDKYISASAIGYYGLEKTNSELTESSPFGNDFLATVCQQWEEEALKFKSIGSRTNILRIGIVQSTNGGFLHKLMLLSKMGYIFQLGDGKNYIPWIHIEDLSRMFQFAIENQKLSGTYNAVAPEHIRQSEYLNILRNKLNINSFNPIIPKLLVQLIFGEMSQIMINGNKVSSQKIINSGFEFKFTDINSTLKDLL